MTKCENDEILKNEMKKLNVKNEIQTINEINNII